MLFNKIEKKFNIQTIVVAQNYKPLVAVQKPYEETYPFWQLFCVGRGSMQILRDGACKTIKEGEIILRPPNQKSTMIYPENCELYLGIIDFICDDDTMNFFGTGPVFLERKEQRMIDEIISDATVFYRDCYSNTLWPEFISSSLENFLVRVYGRLSGLFSFETDENKSNTRNNLSAKVNQINRILEERRFGRITIDEIAYIVHDNPNSLMKCYKKEMNESIMDHFLNLKLQTAIQLISTSEMNFTEISELLGFSSVNYFSKFFKKRYGITPTEFSRRI